MKDPLNVEILRPILDGDFMLIPYVDDPTKCFKLGKGIPEHTRAQLIACLRENVDLFAWSASDMPDVDPSVACHQLTVSPSASAIAQRHPTLRVQEYVLLVQAKIKEFNSVEVVPAN